MSIRIIVDSASDINQKEARELGIDVIPMKVTFKNEEFLDGVDLLPNDFYEKLIESNELPKTSQVNPFDFEKYIKKAKENNEEVLIITISSKLSNTYQSAIIASSEFDEGVYVVDSMNVSVGERMLVLYALKLIKEDKSIKEVVDILNQIKNKICIMARVDTLEYLKKGGRISSLVAFAGELFSIKPVVALIDGKVKMIGKARGSKNANNLLNKIVEEKGGIDFSMPFGAIYSGLTDLTLQKYIKDSAHLWKDYVSDVPIHPIGSTIGTHVGPGAVGLAFFQK